MRFPQICTIAFVLGHLTFASALHEANAAPPAGNELAKPPFDVLRLVIKGATLVHGHESMYGGQKTLVQVDGLPMSYGGLWHVDMVETNRQYNVFHETWGNAGWRVTKGPPAAVIAFLRKGKLNKLIAAMDKLKVNGTLQQPSFFVWLETCVLTYYAKDGTFRFSTLWGHDLGVGKQWTMTTPGKGLCSVRHQRWPAGQALEVDTAGKAVVLTEPDPKDKTGKTVTRRAMPNIAVETVRFAKDKPHFAVDTPQLVLTGYATLIWNVPGSGGASIKPDIGPVPASGKRRVAPAKTTSYTLVTKSQGDVRTVTVHVLGKEPPDWTEPPLIITGVQEITLPDISALLKIGTASITGRLTGQSQIGGPSKVTIHAYHVGNKALNRSVPVNAQGLYRLDMLAQGSYRVMPSWNAKIDYPGPLFEPAHKMVTVKPGLSVTADFKFAR